jgi:hypothetical protein
MDDVSPLDDSGCPFEGHGSELLPVLCHQEIVSIVIVFPAVRVSWRNIADIVMESITLSDAVRIKPRACGKRPVSRRSISYPVKCLGE